MCPSTALLKDLFRVEADPSRRNIVEGFRLGSLADLLIGLIVTLSPPSSLKSVEANSARCGRKRSATINKREA